MYFEGMDRKRLKSYEKGLEIINIHVFKMPGLERYRRIFFFFPANHNYKLWTKEKGKGKLLKVAKDAKLVQNLGTGHPSQDIVSSAPQTEAEHSDLPFSSAPPGDRRQRDQALHGRQVLPAQGSPPHSGILGGLVKNEKGI
uniref:Uncharacterized protein n=1 Tax=Rousettus aegyptiacus TaxID=9407 RepID=A0A7J8B9M2_ROUAE|nr:hypothetical protein HJG63_009915 [Rousettus aegyptiacus]